MANNQARSGARKRYNRDKKRTAQYVAYGWSGTRTRRAHGRMVASTANGGKA